MNSRQHFMWSDFVLDENDSTENVIFFRIEFIIELEGWTSSFLKPSVAKNIENYMKMFDTALRPKSI